MLIEVANYYPKSTFQYLKLSYSNTVININKKKTYNLSRRDSQELLEDFLLLKLILFERDKNLIDEGTNNHLMQILNLDCASKAPKQMMMFS